MPRLLLATILLGLAASPAQAQWTNRYPKVPGYSHHVYLEGFEMPTVAAGPTDPAASPDGRHLAFAARGWLWRLDLDTGRATRITSGPHVDARPAWSPSGDQIAFVRDDSQETWIVTLDLATGTERAVAQAPGIELDPAYSPDGRALVYSAAGDHGIKIVFVDLPTGNTVGSPELLVDTGGLLLAPRLLPDWRYIVYIRKDLRDEVIFRDTKYGEETVLYAGRILSQTRPALSPDGETLALGVPLDDGWELVVGSVEEPGGTLRILSGDAPPLSPAFSADGQHIYFSQADSHERMRLMRVPTVGGAAQEVVVSEWDWGAPTATFTVRTTVDGDVAPTRLALTTGDGHPLLPDDGRAWFDGQTGAVYTYSPGDLTFVAPVGEVIAQAVQGFETPVASGRWTIAGDEIVELDLERAWEAPDWLSGDHHFHLNYGGPYALDAADLDPLLAGEALDVASPLVANLHNRYIDDERWGDDQTATLPYRAFGQEVRSHFFGHVGLVGTETLFNPWIWGPGYEVFSQADHENAAAIAHARSEGGIGTYVHPVAVRDPFTPGRERSVPVELVADGVLGDLDGIEVVCLWTDDLGTSEVWYRLLNLGRVVVPMSGSDVMSNFYRTMAPGTARMYVAVGEDAEYEAYMDALKAGRSVASTGPMLDAEVGGAGLGEIVRAGRVPYRATLMSAVPVDRIEVVVNGTVVATHDGLAEPGQRTVEGSVDLPEAGWVAVRAWSDELAGWPTMATYPFAHTAPVWIGEEGSVLPQAQQQAARDLLRILDVSESRFEMAYQGADAPRLRARFAAARSALSRLATD